MSAVTLCAQSRSNPKDSPDTPKGLAGLDRRVMDLAADPCVDFHQYACGKFSNIYPIPADQTRFGTTTLVLDRTQAALHRLLEKAAIDNPNRTADEQKIGDYYASCMDTSAIDSLGLKPLQPDLNRILSLKDKQDLAGLLAHLQLLNVNAFLEFGVQQDYKDARKQIAVLDQGGLGLPERGYYLRSGAAAEKTRQQYLHHVANTFLLLGEPEAQASADADLVMRMETALAQASMDVTSRRDPANVYHPMPLSKLSEFAPAIDWEDFLKDIGAPPLSSLNVRNPDFFKGLNTLIQNSTLEQIQTYLRWQLMASTPGIVLPKALDNEEFDFYGKELVGQPMQQARWKRCARATDSALGEALGKVYVTSEFSPASREGTRQIVDNIEKAMEADIDTLDWMSPETKLAAKHKLHLIADKIGYPDHWRDYSKLRIVRGDAMGNLHRATVFENRRQLAKIGRPVDRGEWHMTAPTVNAYYSPTMNDINFPAGILQPPLFDPDATDAENYGHMGAIVGHELTHGFDDQGRQFDGNGNLSDWWTQEDARKFKERTDCEVKEYDGFTAIDDIRVNGKLTLGENTADNGGLRLAYLAFLADVNRKRTDLDRQNNGFTPLQQFFLAYAQNWCGDTRPERLRLQAQTDPHSPPKFRVNGVVQNMSEFGKAFGCKPGQPMMPVNMCRVW